MLPGEPLINAVDLPTHLGQIPDRQVHLNDRCPKCRQKDLYGMMEASTGSVYDVGCISCGWDEEMDGYPYDE